MLARTFLFLYDSLADRRALANRFFCGRQLPTWTLYALDCRNFRPHAKQCRNSVLSGALLSNSSIGQDMSVVRVTEIYWRRGTTIKPRRGWGLAANTRRLQVCGRLEWGNSTLQLPRACINSLRSYYWLHPRGQLRPHLTQVATY